GQRSRSIVISKASIQIRRDICFAQQLEPQLLAISVKFELLLHRAQRVIAREHLGWSIRPENEQARRLSSPGDRRNQFERRKIAPVEIFEREHQRRFRREGLQRLRHLAQHPLLSNSLSSCLQLFPIGVAQQRRHLREPGRRELAQQLNYPLTAGLLTEAGPRPAHRPRTLPRG